MLLRERGDNRVLASEVIDKLSISSKQRLLHVINDIKSETSNERRKRKRGQFW